MQVTSISECSFLTSIKLPHGFKTFVLSNFQWPLKTGVTVYQTEKETLLFQTLVY